MIRTSSSKRTFGSQPELLLGLRRVPNQQINFCRALVTLIVPNVLFPIQSNVSESKFNMALRAKIVDFVRLQLVEEFDQLHGIRQVPETQEEVYFIHMRVLVQMIDAGGVKRAGSPDDAMNLVALG